MRLTRNTRVSLPFWAAIPLFLVWLAVMAAFFVLVVGAWLLWALIALPIAGIASLRHKNELSDKMVGSLNWTRKRLAPGRHDVRMIGLSLLPDVGPPSRSRYGQVPCPEGVSGSRMRSGL
jgi:hypothetical protein